MICAIEPICTGGEHALINAALLTAVRLAYPEEQILLLAESGHMDVVSKSLLSEGVDGVEFSPIELPPTKRGVGSFPAEYRLCRNILNMAQEKKSTKVIFLAVNAPELLCLKVLLRNSYNDINVMVIPHSTLQSILRRAPRKPWNRLIWFRNALRWSMHERIKLVALGESIRQITQRELPQLEPHLHVLNLAYFFPDSAESGSERPDGSIQFGFPGVGTMRKGIDTFLRLAEEFSEARESLPLKPEFSVIGQVLLESLREEDFKPLASPPPDRFLAPEEMAELTRRLHYTVFPYRAEVYQLVASAAFLDAFLYLKPIIALKNPYFEYYFNEFGDIGYLCETFEEMVEVVKSLLHKWPEERYRSQQKNMLEGRVVFTPVYLSEKVKAVFS